MKIGVLALQGAFEEHIKKLHELGVEAYEIRQLRDLNERPDGLIIPGGESTVMSKLLDDLGMRSKVLEYATSGVPVFGTCAGLILMSKETGDPRCTGLGLIARQNAMPTADNLAVLIPLRNLEILAKSLWCLSVHRISAELVTELMFLPR